MHAIKLKNASNIGQFSAYLGFFVNVHFPSGEPSVTRNPVLVLLYLFLHSTCSFGSLYTFYICFIYDTEGVK